MIRYIPLRDWPHAAIPVEPPFGVLDEIAFVPLADTEMHLSAHYFPLAVSLAGPRACLGAIVHGGMHARALVTPDGKWTGGYTPIVLRCFPFRLCVATPTGDPIADMELGRIMPLRKDPPRVLRVRDDQGEVSRDLKTLYEGIKTVWEGQARLLPGLDMLLAADLLVPIGKPAGGEQADTLFTIDRRRYAAYSNAALEAMARRSFQPIDLATVLGFSLGNLRAELRPEALSPEVPATEATAAGAAPETGFGSGLEQLTPWLDTSELFPGAWAAAPSVWAGSDAQTATPAGASERAPAGA